MIITKLYKGTVDLQFDELKHRFFVNGEFVPGVTSCTSIIDKSGPLLYWATNLSRDYLLSHIKELIADKKGDTILQLIEEATKQHQIKKKEAADLGTEAHKWAELFIKAKTKKDIPPMPKDERVYNAITAFLGWADEYEVKFLSSERHIYSKKHKYAGIMDAEAVINRKRCVVDFKTSKGFYSEYRFQVAAYQAAAEEESGQEYSGDKWIVRFGKEDAQFEARQFDQQAEDFLAFRAAKALRERVRALDTYQKEK
jgi:hypothetical protein